MPCSTTGRITGASFGQRGCLLPVRTCMFEQKSTSVVEISSPLHSWPPRNKITKVPAPKPCVMYIYLSLCSAGTREKSTLLASAASSTCHQGESVRCITQLLSSNAGTQSATWEGSCSGEREGGRRAHPLSF